MTVLHRIAWFLICVVFLAAPARAHDSVGSIMLTDGVRDIAKAARST